MNDLIYRAIENVKKKTGPFSSIITELAAENPIVYVEQT